MTDAKAGEQCPSCNHSGGCCRGGVNECNCDAKAGELAEVGARVRGALTKARQRKDWNLPAGLHVKDVLRLCAAASRVAQLEGELQEAKTDAERFRWLEENGVGIQHGCAVSLVVPVGRTSGGEMVSALVHDENLRDAIDAARREP